MSDPKHASTILTPNEYEAWTLAERGLSQRTIALALNVSRSTIRSRLENARRKLAQHEKGVAAEPPSIPHDSELGHELSRRLWINPRKDDAA